ncbi:hypothetical protein KAJ89_02365, partial [Candidatus Parcubacteria bacterium]|nr:hypothetical protein [Candidatus Parcubacteria bacterium]
MLKKIKSLYKNKVIRLAILFIVLTAMFGYSGGRFYFVKAFNNRVNIFPGSFAVEQIDNGLVWGNVDKSFYQDLSADAEYDEFTIDNAAYIMSSSSLAQYLAKPPVSDESSSDDWDDIEVLGTEGGGTVDVPEEPSVDVPEESVEEGELKIKNEELINEEEKTEETFPDEPAEETIEEDVETLFITSEEEERAEEPTSEPAAESDELSLFDKLRQGLGSLISTAKQLDLFNFKLAQAQDESSVLEEESNIQYTLLNQNIVFSDFSVPLGYEENSLAQINLRLSLAAFSEYVNDYLLLEYRVNGEWHTLEELSLDKRISNQLNGGYLLYNLSENISWEDLDDLKVRISYLNDDLVSDTEDRALEIFLDAIWLEVDYNDPTMETEYISEEEGDFFDPESEGSEVAEDDKDNEKYELKLMSNKLEFKSGEMPAFNFRISKKENFLKKILTNIAQSFRDEYQFLGITARLASGETFEPQIDYLENGEFEIKFDKLPRQIRPGKNTILVFVQDGSERYAFSQDFTWGVLAVNTNKSIYLPYETAYLQMAVLDDNGNTLCQVEYLNLGIKDPSGHITYLSTFNGGIQENPECGPNNVIDSPDYYAYYKVATPGIYQMTLTAQTANGVREIVDSFEVRDELPFEIERVGPTRIYPWAGYGMDFIIRSNMDFQGEFKEFTPVSFKIMYSQGARVEEVGDTNEIIWEVDWQKGKTYHLRYTFDAPNVSPEFYLLGPLRLADARSGQAGRVVFEEARQWQIASDADMGVVLEESIGVDSGTTDTVSWTTAVVASSSEFSGGDKYLIYVTSGFAGSATGVNTDFEIVYGTSVQYVGLVEGPGDNYDAFPISWFDVYDQPATPNDITLRYRTNSGASYALNAQILAINLSDLETTDWEYASNTTQVEHTNSMTARANITLSEADGTKDWLIMGMEEVQIDSSGKNYQGEIYNGSASYMGYSMEGESTAELLTYVLYLPFDNVAVSTQFSIRTRDDSSSGLENDHVKSRIFALNLDAFENHKTYYANINTALSATPTWTEVGNLNNGGNYQPTATGDQLIFASFIDDAASASAGTNNRLQVNGVTTPSSWSWVQSPIVSQTTHDATDESLNNIITKISIPSSGHSIDLDATEIISNSQIADEVSLTVFSAKIKSPIELTADDQTESDGTSIVNGDWSEDSAVKLKASINSGRGSASAYFYFQLLTDAGTFSTATSEPGSACSSGIAFGSCASKIWTVSASTTGAIASATVDIITLSDTTYKWQVNAFDEDGYTPGWRFFNTETPNFGIDTATPTAPGPLTEEQKTGTTITLGFGTSTTEANFSEYKIFYKQGTSSVSEDDTEHNDSNLEHIDYNSADTTVILGLQPSTAYVFNIWVYDEYGRIASSTEITITTTESISVVANEQYKSDIFTAISNGGWTDEEEVNFSASASDSNASTTNFDFYFELLDENGTFTTATSAPASPCSVGTTYGGCTNRIWIASASTTSWYDGDWEYRKKITINASQVATTTTGFIVLATTTDSNLAHMASGGHMGSSTGADIVITDSDAVTALDYEREYYDSSTGETVLWIKADVSSTINKILYLYYGNSGVSADMSTTTGVWDDNYIMVQHLDETSGTHYDSTQYSNDASTVGGVDQDAIGQFDGADDFDGENDYIDTDASITVNSTTGWTGSAWVYLEAENPARQYILQHLGGSGQSWLYRVASTDQLESSIGGSVLAGGSINLNQWHYAAVTIGTGVGADKILYLDGNIVASGTEETTANTDDFRIGSHRVPNNNNEEWDGILDEIRLSNTARSTGWIETEYNNQSSVSDFLSFANEENINTKLTEMVINIASIPDRGSTPGTGYKWQVLACTNMSLCTNWDDFNSTIPNFKVDTVPPDAPGNLTLATTTASSITVKFGSSTIEANFADYKIFYKAGFAEVDVTDIEHNDSNLDSIDYDGATSTIITGLSPDTKYVINIWAYDLSGSKTSAAEITADTKAAPHARARSVIFPAGNSTGNGTTGENTDTNYTFSSFNYRLAETDVGIRNAYILFEAQFEAYHSNSSNYVGYNLAFDTCLEPCMADAFSGTGRILKDDNTVLAYNESESNQVRLLLDVTDEAQLAAYVGDGANMEAQVGYRLETGAATTSIANAKAMLIVTYSFDDDNSTNITNTVIYPLESTSGGDSGTRLSSQSDGCIKDTDCPLFSYNMEIPEVSTRLSSWFQTYAVNDGNGANDISLNVNIEGTNIDSDTFIHEASNSGDQSSLPRLVFANVSGFAANTAQTLEYYADSPGVPTYYLMGGEVAETYIAAKSATTKTRTVSFPIGVMTNGQDTATASGTVNVYFPENGGGSGIVDVKKAWFRVISNNYNSGAYTQTISTKVGNNVQSGNYAYNLDAGDLVIKPAFNIIHVVPSSDYSELETANSATPKAIVLYTTNSSVNMGGVTAELMITYTYTDESSGYLASLNLYGGQGDVDGNTQDVSLAIAPSVFPELRGTETVRAGALQTSYLISDSDGDVPAAWFTMDANISTGSPSCVNAFYHHSDGFNSFAEFFKDVTPSMDTVDAEEYNACYSNVNGTDATTGAKMNAIWLYTYQWQAPNPLLTQHAWRWYENVDSIDPSVPKADEKIAISNVNIGDILRLRMNIGELIESVATSTQNFKLQYATGTDCTVISDWDDVGSVAGGQPWIGYNNPDPVDGATLSSNKLASSTVAESYEEENPSANIPRGLSDGEFGEWDWAIYNQSASSSSNYCFRMVFGDGLPLDDYLSNSFAKLTTASANTEPNNPGSLGQYLDDGISVISNLSWINESDVKLTAAVTDPNISEVITLYFELASSTGSFTTATTVPSGACLSGTAYTACPGKIWAASSSPGDYRSTPFIGTSSITSILESSPGYKWQVLACDDSGVCSDWTVFNAVDPNFKIDTTPPSSPGDLIFSTSTPTTITLDLGASTTEINFSEYKIFYKVGTAGVTESDTEFDHSIFDHQDYDGATTTLVTDLSANTTYVFNIFAYDLAGNKASATIEVIGTTTSAFNPPTGFIDNTTEQKIDGSGIVDIAILVDDPDNDDTLRAKVFYEAGQGCGFATLSDPTIDETDLSITATYGDPDADNNYPYQVGTTSAWIVTSPGFNYVFFDWQTKTDLPAADGYYCLGLVVNDGGLDQVATHTKSFYIDNVDPTAPGPLATSTKSYNSATLAFGSSSVDTNFEEYKIFYKEGTSGVSENDSEWNQADDSSLNSANYSGATTTTIIGLSPNTWYVFNIFAYDSYGNKASATVEFSIKTNAIPTNISASNQYLSDGATNIANNTWIDENSVILRALAHDQDSADLITFYYELISATGTYATATSVPSDTCASGTAFGACSSNIWAVSTSSSELPADWYNKDWFYRKQITINAAQVATTSSDFPILATTTDSDLASYARFDGYDIVFTDSGGTTTLNYEREYFNPSTGELTAWIKTDISSTTDTVLYMYYGNSAASTDQATTTGAWSSTYAGVWHLSESVVDESSEANAHLDSTAGGNDGDQYGNNEMPGQIYRGQEFDGINDYVDIGNTGSSINTVSFWMKADSLSEDIIDLDGGTYTISIVSGVATTTGFVNPTIYIDNVATTTIDTGWHYMTVVTDTAFSVDNFDIARIGSNYYNGMLDEVRISNTARSAAWVKTQLNNQSNVNNFLSIGSATQVTSFYETTLVITIPDNPDYSSGYKWQAMACDDDNDCSAWDQFNVVTPNFKVDTSDPSPPGQLSESSKTSNTITLDFGAPTDEDNFVEYKIYYSTSSPVSEADNLHGSSTDPNLNFFDYDGAADTIISGLNPNTTYYFNIWAYDIVGHKASSTFINVTTIISSSSPGVTFYTKGTRTLYYNIWSGSSWTGEQAGPNLGSNADFAIRHIRTARSDDGGKIGILAKASSTTGLEQEWWGTVYRFAADDFVGSTKLGATSTSAVNAELITGCLAALSGNEFVAVRNNNTSDGTLIFSWNSVDGWSSEGPGPDPGAVLNGCELVRRPNTDNYLLMTFDDDVDVGSSYYYGGSTYSNSWTTWTGHATQEDDTNNYVGEAFFDLSDNTRGAINYSGSVSNDYTYAKYFSCGDSSINYGGAVASPATAPDDWSSDFVHGEFAADPGNTGIAYYVGRDTSGELNVYQLDVSSPVISWATTTNGDNVSSGDLYSETNYSQKPLAINFYKSGKGVVALNYNTDPSVPIYSVIDTSGNSLSATSSVPGAGSNLWTRVRFYDDPGENEFVALYQNDDIDYAAAFWDGGNDAFYSVGNQAWTEIVTAAGALEANDENISFAFTAYNAAPDSSGSLEQYKSNASTTIANEDWTDETTVKFEISATDLDTYEIITLYLNLVVDNDDFTTSTVESIFNACASTTQYGSCNSKIWAVASSTVGDYSVTPFTATATITTIASSTIGYKWQAIACDDEGECSAWSEFNAVTPNFYVDDLAPSAPGSLSDVNVTSNSVTLQFGAATVEDNFSEYKIFYKIGASGVTESDNAWTQIEDGSLGIKNYGSATNTIITNLSSSTQYVFNIWSYDLAGNKASATAPVATTTHAAANLEQTSYLLENDDGSDVNSNTAEVAASTTLSNINIGERINARIQIENNGSDIAASKVYILQYENLTDAAGIWNDVGAATEISYSPGFSGSNGNAITSNKAVANTNTWADGTWHENTNVTGSFSLTNGNYTEFVFAIETSNATAGKTYRLRLFNNTDNKALNGYDNYSRFSTVATEIKRYSKGLYASLPSGAGDLTYYLDPKGYADVLSDDSNRGNATSTSAYPIYLFATKHINSTDAASSSWNGQSSVAPSVTNVVLQVYRYGTTNAWVTLDTEAAASANTDFNLNGALNSSLSEYYAADNWILWRVYQGSGSQTLKTDYYQANFAAPVPVTEQIHYRWRNDDGTQISATWLEAEDIGNPTVGAALNKGSSTRLRLAIANTGGGDATNYNYRLEYASSSAGCASDPGYWETVPITATTEHFEMATSSYFNDSDPTTTTTTNSEGYNFVAGDMVEDPSNATGNITLSEEDFTEIEYIIEVTNNATDAETYCFRVTNGGTVLDNYDIYSPLTLAGSTNAAPSFTAGPSDNGSASTTPTDYGTNVNFSATANDGDGNNYYLAFCQTNSIAPGNDAPPTCNGGDWCVSSSTASGVGASCAYMTATSTEVLDWYAFACDKVPGFGIAKCSGFSQGTGNILNDSPFVINYPPDFTSATTTDNNKDPGETYTITASVIDNDTAGGADTMDLFVCTQNSAVAGAGCAGVGNVELCFESATTSPNASCTFSTSTPAIAGIYTYYAFIFDSHNLAATPASRSGTYTVNDVAPVLGGLLLNNGSAITLNIRGAGDTSVSTVNLSVLDANGCYDLVSAVGRIYMSNAANGFNCTADDNDCYHADVGSCVITDCASSTDQTASITCTAGLEYFAIPTDDDSASNPWKNYNWLSYIQVYDGTNYSATTSPGVELDTTLALSVEEAVIDFGGGMDPGDNTGTDNATSTVVNSGNCPIDANVSGTDMNGDPFGSIPVGNIKWDLDNFNYPVSGTSLSTGDDKAEIIAPKATSTVIIVNDDIYWGLSIPSNASSSVYTGQNSFSVILDEN